MLGDLRISQSIAPHANIKVPFVLQCEPEMRRRVYKYKSMRTPRSGVVCGGVVRRIHNAADVFPDVFILRGWWPARGWWGEEPISDGWCSLDREMTASFPLASFLRLGFQVGQHPVKLIAPPVPCRFCDAV